MGGRVWGEMMVVMEAPYVWLGARMLAEHEMYEVLRAAINFKRGTDSPSSDDVPQSSGYSRVHYSCLHMGQADDRM